MVALGRSAAATPGGSPAGGGTAAGSPASGAAAGPSASSLSSGDLGEPGFFWDLLQHPDTDTSIPRAKSASDASLLRRKGHLKEQDKLIEYMRHMHETHTCEEAMFKIERWIAVRGSLMAADERGVRMHAHS